MVQSKIITIPTASSGRIQVDAAHSTLVQLGFDPNAASVERSDNDLVFTLDNGAVFVLKSFFVTDGADLPHLKLPDGTEVASTDLLTALNSYMDISTAAGPTASASNGINDYADNAGDLLGGMDRLGDLDTFYWEKGIDEGSNRLGIASLGGIAGTAGTAGPGYEGGEGVAPPLKPTSYDARMVLHRPDDASGDQVYCHLLDGNNEPVAPGTNFDPSTVSVAGKFFTVAGYDSATGLLILELTTAGKDWLASNPGANLYDYITITHEGREYTVQVQVNQDGNFVSDTENLSGDAILGKDGLIHGEWHQGKDLDGASIISSDLGDDVNFSGNIKGSEIHTRDGHDTINIVGNIIASNIDAGDDINTITVGGLRQDSGYGSTIKSGGGTITVKDNQVGMWATADAKNTITADAAIVEIAAEGSLDTSGLFANGGLNKISGKEVEISATSKYQGAYGLRAAEGTNEVSSQDGITITANASNHAYGLFALNAGKNILENENSAINILATSDSGSTGLHAYASTPLGSGEFHNTIINKNGDINIRAEQNSNWAQYNTGTGVKAYKGGSNKLEALNGTIDISASTGYFARGVHADTGGFNKVDAKNINVTATGEQGRGTTAYGLISNGKDSKNEITFTEDMNIIAQNANTVSGIRGFSNSGVGFANLIDGKGTGSLTIHALNGRHSSGIHSDFGHNKVTDINNLSINVTSLENTSTPNSEAQSPGAFGLSSTAGSNIIDKVKGNVDINVGNVLGNTNTNKAYGMYASGNKALNKLSNIGGSINMEVHGNQLAMGMYASSGSNIIENTADVTLNVSGKEAYGMYANPTGENTINGAKAVNLNVNGLGDGTAYGMFTDKGGTFSPTGLNSIKNADSVDIKVDNAANAYGMYAKGSGYENTIEGISGNVKLSVEGKDASVAMFATSGGENTIIANTIDIGAKIVNGGTGEAHALFAQDGINKLTSNVGHNLTLTITAEAGSLDKAYAMLASGTGINHIIGHSQAGENGDNISITGKIETQDTGKNIIETGAGNDTVLIDGSIIGVGNSVSTGDGNDHVTLDMKQKVDSNFKLEMGTDANGQDIDILTIIAPADKFEDFYSDWLTELLKGDHGIEKINVGGYTSDSDFLWLQNMINEYNISGIGKPIELTNDYDTNFAAPFSQQEEFDDALESAASSVAQGEEEAENNTLITIPELEDSTLFALSGLDLASDTEGFETLFGSEADLPKTIDAANISAPELIAENNTLISMPEPADTGALFDLIGLDLASDTEDLETLFGSEADLPKTTDAANISAPDLIAENTAAATLKGNESDKSDSGQSTAGYSNTEFQTGTNHGAEETALLIHLIMGT